MFSSLPFSHIYISLVIHSSLPTVAMYMSYIDRISPLNAHFVSSLNFNEVGSLNSQSLHKESVPKQKHPSSTSPCLIQQASSLNQQVLFGLYIPTGYLRNKLQSHGIRCREALPLR